MTDKTATTKRPPMAKAIREFVAGMDFPPATPNSDTNFKLAGLVLAMLQFCKGLSSGTTTATVSPAVSQLAELMHCSKPTIERRLRRLRQVGLLTQKGRGHASTLYTFHQTRQQLMPLANAQTHQQLKGLKAGSAINSGSQRHQLDPSAPSTQGSAPSTVDALWCKASGSSLEKNTLESKPVPDLSVSDLNQVTLPDGFVLRNGKVVMVGGVQ